MVADVQLKKWCILFYWFLSIRWDFKRGFHFLTNFLPVIHPSPPACQTQAHCIPWNKCLTEHVAALCSFETFERSHWLQTVRTSSKLQTHTFIWRFGSINRGRGERVEHRSHLILTENWTQDTQPWHRQSLDQSSAENYFHSQTR